MEIRAAEISAILKSQIENFGTEADVAEVGQVLDLSLTTVKRDWRLARLWLYQELTR